MRRIFKTTTALVACLSIITPQLAMAQVQQAPNGDEQLILPKQKKKQAEEGQQQKPRQQQKQQAEKQAKPQAEQQQKPRKQAEPKPQKPQPEQKPNPAREAAPPLPTTPTPRCSARLQRGARRSAGAWPPGPTGCSRC